MSQLAQGTLEDLRRSAVRKTDMVCIALFCCRSLPTSTDESEIDCCPKFQLRHAGTILVSTGASSGNIGFRIFETFFIELQSNQTNIENDAMFIFLRKFSRGIFHGRS